MGKLVAEATEKALAKTGKPELVSQKAWTSLDECCSYLRDKFASISKLGLEFCWEIGFEAVRIQDEAVYGEATVEDFVAKLEIPNLDIRQVYKYAQFAKMYTRKELMELLLKEHMGWGVVSRLIRVKDDGKRALLEERIASGEVQTSKLDEEVNKINEELKTPPTSTREPAAPAAGETNPKKNYKKVIDKMTGTCKIIDDDMENCLNIIVQLQGEVDATDKWAKEENSVYDMRELIEKLLPKLKVLCVEAEKIA